MLLDIKYNTNQDKLYEQQQHKINKLNIRENLKCFKYNYKIGDKELAKCNVNDDIIHPMDYVNEGLYCIMKVYSDERIKI